MSVIVVVKKMNKTVIGSDTLSGQGDTRLSAKYVRNKSKILEINHSLIGLAGSLTDYLVMESVGKKHADLLCFDSISEIFESLRKLQEVLRTEYYTLPNEDDEEQPYESNQLNALIANQHGIFEIQSYREVLEYTRFWAIGSGKRLALGAMHAVYDLWDDPMEIAKAGLEAACEFDKSCGRPVEYFVVEV